MTERDWAGNQARQEKEKMTMNKQLQMGPPSGGQAFRPATQSRFFHAPPSVCSLYVTPTSRMPQPRFAAIGQVTLAPRLPPQSQQEDRIRHIRGALCTTPLALFPHGYTCVTAGPICVTPAEPAGRVAEPAGRPDGGDAEQCEAESVAAVGELACGQVQDRGAQGRVEGGEDARGGGACTRVYRGGLQGVYRGYTGGLDRGAQGRVEGGEDARGGGPQGVHRGSTGGPQWVHSLSTQGPQGVHRGSTGGPQGVHRGFTVGPQLVHTGSTRGPHRVHTGSTQGPQWVHRLSTQGSQGVHRGSAGGPQGVHRGSTGEERLLTPNTPLPNVLRRRTTILRVTLTSFSPQAYIKARDVVQVGKIPVRTLIDASHFNCTVGRRLPPPPPPTPAPALDATAADKGGNWWGSILGKEATAAPTLAPTGAYSLSYRAYYTCGKASRWARGYVTEILGRCNPPFSRVYNTALHSRSTLFPNA
eukprot:1176104-Prorocentrum_minimum.AAC.1